MPDQAAMNGTSRSIIGPIDFRRAEAEEFLPGGLPSLRLRAMRFAPSVFRAGGDEQFGIKRK